MASCEPQGSKDGDENEMSTGAMIGTLLGGPLVWACRASHYLRPEETDEEYEEMAGVPFWRQVRRVELDAERYLEVLGVQASELQRGRVETLELLHRAHRTAIARNDRTHAADVRIAYGDAILRRQAVSPAECNLLFGWLASRLELFYELKFVLARRRRPEAEPMPPVLAASTIRAPQPNWGAPNHIVLFVLPSPSVKRLVDCALSRPVDLLEVIRPDAPTSPDNASADAAILRVVKHHTNLYSVDSFADYQCQSLLLFDTRIKRPHDHFAPNGARSSAFERACVDVDGI